MSVELKLLRLVVCVVSQMRNWEVSWFV